MLCEVLAIKDGGRGECRVGCLGKGVGRVVTGWQISVLLNGFCTLLRQRSEFTPLPLCTACHSALFPPSAQHMWTFQKQGLSWAASFLLHTLFSRALIHCFASATMATAMTTINWMVLSSTSPPLASPGFRPAAQLPGAQLSLGLLQHLDLACSSSPYLPFLPTLALPPIWPLCGTIL